MPLFRANGFDSELPPGWTDRSTLVLVGPTSADGFAANIVVTRQPLARGTSAASFGRAQLEALAAEVAELKTEDQRGARLRGREIYQCVHLLRAGERWVRQLQTYFVLELGGETVGFVVTGSSTPEDFDAVFPQLRRFIEAFEPHDGRGGR